MMLLDIVHAIDPLAIQRARRVEVAIQMLEAGHQPADVRAMLRSRYGMLQPAAWRIVDIAVDMAVIDEEQK